MSPSVCVSGACSGLVGSYYDSMDFTGRSLTRTDAIVDFNWAYDAPAPGIGPDHFSVRWTGNITPRYSETYTFYATSDDGVVLWVKDAKLIDDWTQHRAFEDSGSIPLLAGVAYAIKLEFFDNINEAVIMLSWSSATQSKEIVPTTQLTP